MSQTFGNLKDLSRLMGGAVQERWEDALGRMTRNILDPNTESRRARKITMVLTIKPTESRDGGEMSFDVKESFAPPTPVKQSVFFDQTDDGTIYATQKLNQVAGSSIWPAMCSRKLSACRLARRKMNRRMNRERCRRLCRSEQKKGACKLWQALLAK